MTAVWTTFRKNEASLSLRERDRERGYTFSSFLVARHPGLKWSNSTGHLVKVVKLPNEVRYDNREKTTSIQP
jgi:hypothetical protein